MKVKLLLKRNYTKQYSGDEWAKGTECKVVDIDLPNITNEDSRRNSFVGEWQIVGYEEIQGTEEKEDDR